MPEEDEMADNEREIHISDEQVLARLVTGDQFADGGCTECGLRGGLFSLRGRYSVLCPWCAKQRMDSLDLELGGLPEDIEQLRREVVSEAHMQMRLKAQSLPVAWESVWRCDQCGDRMHRFEVRLIPAGEEAAQPGASGAHEKVCYACLLVRLAKGGIRGWPWEGSDPSLPANPEGLVP